ncbi:MAG TPA: DUF4124 domain-containing protein [Deltaproteobacteria bacterium]|nr:DUF4124 domain-containing protein [Deltaproteobacteria bacterium]
MECARISFVGGWAFFIFALAAVHTARADYYMYVDDGGVVHMTNKKEGVPEKYRDSVRVVKSAPPRRKAPAKEKSFPALEALSKEPAGESAARVPAGAVSQGPVPAAGAVSMPPWWENRYARTAAATVLFVAAVFMVRALLSRYVEDRRIARLVTIFMVSVLMIYLFREFALESRRRLDRAKEYATAVKEGIEKKERERLKEMERMLALPVD